MALRYIIDGYNVINKVSFLAGKKLKDSRDALLSFINIYRPQGSHKNEIIVVFDGKKDFIDFTCNCEFSVVFTKGISADNYIKSFVEESPNPKNIIVVSDDKDIIFYCRAQGAGILTVFDFIKKGQKKLDKLRNKNEDFFELSYLERKKINEELSKIWLK